jgi:hypothetical protein
VTYLKNKSTNKLRVLYVQEMLYTIHFRTVSFRLYKSEIKIQAYETYHFICFCVNTSSNVFVQRMESPEHYQERKQGTLIDPKNVP